MAEVDERAAGVPVRYYSALVAYDGTDYHGFQVQRNASSVQGALEATLNAFTLRASRVVGAGRTDAGVHALGQVIAVRLGWAHTAADLQRAWNAHLPPAITVRCVVEAPDDFHPRFSALSRTYRYTVRNAGSEDWRTLPRRSPLTDRFALFEGRPLDEAVMEEAARHLVGTHDFATFGQPPEPGDGTVRTVLAARWDVTDEALGLYPGRQLVFTITANAFLRQMVRNIVGTLLAVGRGEWRVADVANALAARRRNRSAPPAAPQGLVLEKVTYPHWLDGLIHGNSSTDIQLPQGTEVV